MTEFLLLKIRNIQLYLLHCEILVTLHMKNMANKRIDKRKTEITNRQKQHGQKKPAQLDKKHRGHYFLQILASFSVDPSANGCELASVPMKLPSLHKPCSENWEIALNTGADYNQIIINNYLICHTKWLC